ncbi:hypothetical protein JTE90_001283 [Oedothorax gibbosus]|uniref:Uncharacterized protein n=1 Tax=Oedothorax gibbosus TaxID=931172 RepID=A0AAV6V474_9ARAC|nr:hypothetical protein JTE90_001283 [Oedothorax gibbosus]
MYLYQYRPLRPLQKPSKKDQKIGSHAVTKCRSIEPDSLENVYEVRPSFDGDYDYPNDYWKFMKCVKYFRYGRPLTTSLAMLAAYDCNFQDPIMLKAIKDYKFIEMLLNLLQCCDKRIQTISLRFLKKLSDIELLRRDMVYFGGIEDMVRLLEQPQMDLKQAAAETIAAVADFHKGWEAVRLAGGIPLLVNMIYVPKILLFEPYFEHGGKHFSLSSRLVAVVQAAEAAAEALYAVCECDENKVEFLLSGALKGCQNILKTSHVRLCTLILQVIERCSSLKNVRLAIRNANMLKDFRVHFYSKDQKLMQAAALASFKCSDGHDCKEFFGKPGFVNKLYEIIQTSAFHMDYDLMSAVSGDLWKCAENQNNLKRFQSLNAAPLLIQLLTSQPIKVQEFLVACLSCCMANPEICTTIRKNNGIETLIGLLHTTHPPLIMHLNKALASASNDVDCLAILQKHNALRFMWSHLQSEDPSLLTNTAWQLATVLKNMQKSSMHIRSLVGGIQVLVERLQSKHTRVLTAVCALIVVLCKDTDNLRTLTDYRVVDRLSKLTDTKCRRLRYHLCMAITACCSYKNNREEFAKRHVVFPLLRMLRSKTPEVSGAATQALHQLAYIPRLCAVMYNSSGVYEILMKQMKSNNVEVQECSAGVIQKMRLFALNRDGYIPAWLIEKHRSFFTK